MWCIKIYDTRAAAHRTVNVQCFVIIYNELNIVLSITMSTYYLMDQKLSKVKQFWQLHVEWLRDVRGYI